MKSMSINGYAVRVYNDGEVKIFAGATEMEDEEILVVAKYLYDEAFIDEDEEIFIKLSVEIDTFKDV